jgi:hypothetical protein
MTSYRNPWAKPLDPEDFTTDKPPRLHAGCEIYERIPGCFDVVKAGCCFSQRAGPGGAKEVAEAVADLLAPTPEDAHERMLERHGRL